MDITNIFLLIFLIIIGIIFIKKYFYVMNVESFDNFSPYMGNNSYPYVYQKNNDQKMLNRTLENWEAPFNLNDEGYYNAGFLPPYVYINSYKPMKYKLFKTDIC